MRHEDFVKELRKDPEYLAAEAELMPYLVLSYNVTCKRINSSLSIKDLSRKAGVRQREVFRMEMCIHSDRIRLSRIVKVANALGVTVADLFEGCHKK